MEQAAALLILATLGSKLVDVARYVKGQDWNAVVTQVVVWAVGIGLTFLASAANQFGGLVVPGLGVALNDLDGWSKVLVGSALLSALSKVVDFQKVFDQFQSARVPSLTSLGTNSNPPAA